MIISRVEALGFRSLRYVNQSVAPFQVLVGPNGSGKSSFLDVISFVGDLLKAGPHRAIIGDATVGVEPRAADPSYLAWMRERDDFELAIEMTIPPEHQQTLGTERYSRVRYEIGVRVGPSDSEVGITAETLWLAPPERAQANGSVDSQRTLFPMPPGPPERIVHATHKQSRPGWKRVVSKVGESGNDYFSSETSGWRSPFRLGPTRSALANLPEDESRFPVGTWVKRTLMEGIHRVVLSAEAIRAPSAPGSPQRFLPDGSNLPWVVESLRKNDRPRFKRWIAHVQTALPELKDIATVERPEDRHRYMVVTYGNGLRAPSWVLSDGTLRLLALTLISYLDEPDSIYLIEEPENGIHPRAVETVYQSLSSVLSSQILCASHSAVILGMAQPSNLLCFARDPSTGATDIVRGSDHPRLREWRGAVDLGTLFAAGVLG